MRLVAFSPRVASGWSLIAIGSVVLAGWALDVGSLKSAVPGLVAMKPNTAICFVLLGSALVEFERNALVRILSLVVAAVGVLTLLEWTGVNAQIDQLFFTDARAATAPGRVSVNAAVALLAAAVALVLARSGKRQRQIAEWLAIGVAAIGWIGVLGYANGVTSLYTFADLTPLALNTAVALVVAAIGIVLGCRDTLALRTMRSRSSGGSLLRRTIPVAVVIPTVGGFLDRLGVEHGIFSDRTGNWIVICGMVTLLVVALVVAARGVNRSEEKMRAYEERLELAQRAARVGAWDWSVPTGSISWSPSLEEIHGLEPGEFGGTYEAWRRLVYADDRSDLEETLREAAAAHEDWTHRFRIVQPNGAVRWLEARGKPLYEGDEANRFIGVDLDITDRVEAETQIEALRAELEQFFALSLEMMCIARADGNFVRVNPRWETVFGWTSDELTGRPFIDYVHPEDRESTLSELAAQVTGDEVFGFTNRYRSKDGSYRWLQWSATAATAEGLIYATARDVTEMRAANERLQASEARYRGLIEMQSELIVRLDSDQRVTFANDAYCRTFGFVREELIGTKGWQEPIAPADLPVVLGTLSKLQHPPHRTLLEQLRETATGQRWTVWEDAAILDADGNVVETQHVGRDIHDRKLAEQELRQSKEELETRVEARTHELVQANEELESFAFSVSHDLRAPLRGIDGFSLALLEDYGPSLDQTAQEYLQRLRQGAQRMGCLIDDLLRLSRISRMELSSGEIDLARIAGEVAEELRAESPDRDITLVIAAEAPAHGDPKLLRIALENLLGNSFKFTRRHASARIEFGRAHIDGETVFFVRDDGAGFDMAYADQLFAPFHRLHAADEFPGTGIGLATVRRIVRRHGGRAWAHGEIERGTTVYFTLGGNHAHA